MIKDMTTGSPTKHILAFSIPLLIGNLFQQFYNMADTLIVGRTLGLDALAGVGATGGISFLVMGFVMGLTSGFAVITAQRFGAEDVDGVRRSAATSISLSIVAAVLLTVIAVLGVRPLLVFMQTPANIIEQSYQYIVVIFAGIAASFFYNTLSNIIRALGDSRTPLYFLVIASLLNIVLDLLFILTFHMGVAGAAFATVLAQIISGLLCLFYVKKRFPVLHLQKKDWRFNLSFALEHLKVGLPMALQFSITAIGVMVVQWALNGLGSSTIAAYTAASKVDMFASQPLQAFGVAMATYVAQNYGAGRLDRVRQGVHRCTIITLVFSVVGLALIFAIGGPVASLFISGDTDGTVLAQARTYLNTVSIFYFALGMLLIYRNTLQGMGQGLVPMLAGVCELIMRIVAAVALSQLMGFTGICLANPVAWLGAMVWLGVAYFITMHKAKKIPQETVSAGDGAEPGEVAS